VLAGDALPPLPWKPEHVAFIHKALYGVTQEGTSARVFAGAPYQSGGKTGTAQGIAIKQGEKYNASRIDERHRDHALYTAFAPLDEPRIAIALVVENAGFGAGAAAPIARRVIDYVLQGLYPSEADIAATQVGNSNAPVGTPRLASAVPLPGYVVHGAMAAASAAVQAGTSLPQPAGAAASSAGGPPESAPSSVDPAVPPPLPEVPAGPAPTVEVGSLDRRELRLAVLAETKGKPARSDADAARAERRAAPKPARTPAGGRATYSSLGGLH
jgi:penicillin-binding protein 2